MKAATSTSIEKIEHSHSKYREVVAENARSHLGERMTAILRFAIAQAIPCPDMIPELKQQALSVASAEELREASLASAALRAGAAVAYGRLVFKFLAGDVANEGDSALNQLRKDRQYMTQMRNADPLAFDRMASFMASLHEKNMALSPKEYELIAIACATVTQCAYCLEKHTTDAVKAGATNIEMAGAVHMAISMRFEASLAELP
ncbi:carboxymuconolactone decarboxylase family protein [Acidovorax sp. MR-S7]|uniref:carboxymuconolactone decarboxylase family protein n=1 Tax=Acidovorax sp. MR-S7 TaxID=1268622 RepID=UPI001331B2F2|nr:carboxymuconolactone decarboxylase family protein [Acidovorax sp. MR-S7]